jgi:hypothetical protein
MLKKFIKSYYKFARCGDVLVDIFNMLDISMLEGY